VERGTGEKVPSWKSSLEKFAKNRKRMRNPSLGTHGVDGSIGDVLFCVGRWKEKVGTRKGIFSLRAIRHKHARIRGVVYGPKKNKSMNEEVSSAEVYCFYGERGNTAVSKGKKKQERERRIVAD